MTTHVQTPATAQSRSASAAPTRTYTNAELAALEHKFTAPNYDPLRAVLTTGNGVWVHDVEGRKYLDMLAGYSALSFGHQHPRIMDAFFNQAKRLTVVSRAFENDQLGPMAQELCAFTGFEQVLPMNTGAEAIESAIKTARKWAYLKKGVAKDQAEIIACTANFHGRTTTVISMSSTPQYKDFFGPLTPGFKLIPFGDLNALKNAITKNTCAFLVEPLQAEGGVHIPPEGYLRECAQVCKQNNVLFICDEVQTGFGRTGKDFAWQWDGESARPDILALGKALGGGVYPISAILSSREIFSVFKAGDHGSTFGGNPLGAAVAREVIKVMRDEKISERAEKTGQWIREHLRAIKSRKIKEIRGRGMLNGIEVHPEAGDAHHFVELLLKECVLCKETAKQVIRITPPIVITQEEAEWGLERIAKVLGD
ncbi:MAG TPA: ornithine--oxo-acid transaminase [Phycisphaerales bacterium]|nr:ornithine--oxo-acid transaminase [Phycisphaerales bacterium]